MDENLIPDALPEDTPATGEAPASLGSEMYKLLVDGVEEEHDIESLKKLASHGKGADKRMTEAQRLKTDTQRLLDLLRQDPIAVRKELESTFDEKDFITKRLAALMEDEMMTPDEKQARQDARELQEYRAKKAQEAEQVQAKNLQEAMQVEYNKLDIEFAEAFEEVGLPKTNEARKRLATMMLEATENGQSIPTKTLAKQVKAEMHQELMELLKSSDDATFEALLGSDLLTKAQKLSLKKIKSPGERTQPRATPREEPTETKVRKTAADFLRDQGIF